MLSDNIQSSLFNDCHNCEAYAACGGNRITAPCGCAWPYGSKRRYQCNKCSIICRERGMYSPRRNLKSKDFESEIRFGLTLDQVSLKQPSFDFPLHIPGYTHKYPSNELHTKWVAIDIRNLFNCNQTKGATIRPLFTNESAIRKYLNVTPDCKLLAVLNGTDKMLETLWAMPRKAVLKKLVSLGFTACTAPTFSLNTLNAAGKLVPYSHHTAMLMRHHRVLSEIQNAGLYAVPNLYWIDNDKREITRWSKWLQANTEIRTISKDFTSTRKWSVIEPKVFDLIQLLNLANRPFHILIIGTGAANAPKVVKLLSEAGHTVSVVTSAPTLKAIRGSKYFINEDGKLSSSPCGKEEHAFSSLINYNSKIFERVLIEVAGNNS